MWESKNQIFSQVLLSLIGHLNFLVFRFIINFGIRNEVNSDLTKNGETVIGQQLRWLIFKEVYSDEFFRTITWTLFISIIPIPSHKPYVMFDFGSIKDRKFTLCSNIKIFSFPTKEDEQEVVTISIKTFGIQPDLANIISPHSSKAKENKQ